jgi:hypothetical protein
MILFMKMVVISLRAFKQPFGWAYIPLFSHKPAKAFQECFGDYPASSYNDKISLEFNQSKYRLHLIDGALFTESMGNDSQHRKPQVLIKPVEVSVSKLYRSWKTTINESDVCEV